MCLQNRWYVFNFYVYGVDTKDGNEIMGRNKGLISVRNFVFNFRLGLYE